MASTAAATASTPPTDIRSDLAGSTRKSLQGAQGVQGQAGPPGPAGTELRSVINSGGARIGGKALVSNHATGSNEYRAQLAGAPGTKATLAAARSTPASVSSPDENPAEVRGSVAEANYLTYLRHTEIPPGASTRLTRLAPPPPPPPRRHQPYAGGPHPTSQPLACPAATTRWPGEEVNLRQGGSCCRLSTR